MSFDGFSDVAGFPLNAASSGANLGSVVVLPPGGNVFYVRGNGTSTTSYNYDPPGLQDKLIASINKALSYCVATRGDIVVVLPGHTESVSTAAYLSNMVAGVRLVGLGVGANRPTLTWTAAASTILMNKVNCSIENMILNMDPGSGSVNVAAPITISAAGNRIVGCTIRMGTDTNSKVTVGITTTAAADDCEISRNHIYGATAAECTTMIDLIGADRLRMIGNYIAGATSSVSVGVVRFATTASTDVFLAYNAYSNRKASSTCAVTGLANTNGVSYQEHFSYLDNASLTPWLTSTGAMSFHRPTVTNNTGETGTEVVGTVSA